MNTETHKQWIRKAADKENQKHQGLKCYSLECKKILKLKSRSRAEI